MSTGIYRDNIRDNQMTVRLLCVYYLKLRDRFSERDRSSSIKLHVLALDCCDKLTASSNACVNERYNQISLLNKP